MDKLNSWKIYSIILMIVVFGCSTISASENENPKKCILVFGAHADDVDEIAGGTLAKYMAQGYQGIYVCVTNNTAGCLLERAPGDKGDGKFTVSDSPQTSFMFS